MPQAMIGLSRDLELASELLRRRRDDGYNPPLPRQASETLVERELKLLRDCDSLTTVTRDSRYVGFTCWTHLAWDSDQLGLPVARLDLLVSEGGYEDSVDCKCSLLKTVAEECRARGMRYLTARVSASDLSTIHALQREAFELLDGLLTFSLKVRDIVPRPANGDIEVRLFRPPDLDQILAIGKSAYTCDRFHVDRALKPGTADRLYETWLRRSCNGQAADAVIVAAKGAEVLSYVTCRLGRNSEEAQDVAIGVIPLVATAAGARGCGIGRAALDGALDWFRLHGAEVVEVGTQMQNVGACRLYEQAGFRMARMNLTFRRLL